MNPIIKVENLSKKYRIGLQKEKVLYKTLRDDLTKTFKKSFYWLMGKRRTKEDFWALKDISFQVERGEILGLIGPNGAGKTTLLKVLTGITSPTKGRAVIGGRVSSLLEVGTGFHPELTGRENIYLNGAIMGMRKRKIDEKFDQIVDFAGVRKFLDTPLKRYSAGMNVRLAFSVAVHLEPDILLIDEVLAVGDVVFQKKSLNKMEGVTRNKRRTIIFVSHNMEAIRKFCKRCILLDRGRIKMIGDTKKVVEEYLKGGLGAVKAKRTINKNNEINIKEVYILNEKNKKTNQIELGTNFKIKILYEVNQNISNSVIFAQIISTDDNKDLVSTVDVDTNENLLKNRDIGQYEAIVEVKDIFLNTNNYNVAIIAVVPKQVMYDVVKVPLEIVEGKKFSNIAPSFHYGVVVNKLKWTINKC